VGSNFPLMIFFSEQKLEAQHYTESCKVCPSLPGFRRISVCVSILYRKAVKCVIFNPKMYN